MDERTAIDVAVIGAGVIGLAVARALALRGHEVFVFEAAASFGTHCSSRNSEVIHSGIYYDKRSLKRRLCVTGREALYAYCEARSVPHRRTGKLLVATHDAQFTQLEQYHRRAHDNGVTDVEFVTARAAVALEPAIRCVGALLSPSTGIVDSHRLMLAYKADAESAGAVVLLNHPVCAGRISGTRIELRIGGPYATTVSCRSLVNAAGLFAQRVAVSIDGLPSQTIPPSYFAKGHYFALGARSSPFSRLIYPLPTPGGLGIHVTLDLAGGVRFGPDVEWVDDIDYGFDDTRSPAFYRAVRDYYPGLEHGSLRPDFTGIRPKLGPEGDTTHDFSIQGPRSHGIQGLVNLYGIESPGLTASLAIADAVAALLQGAAIEDI